MKKIIENQKYDTETAVKVGSRDNGLSRRDINCIQEDLYRKKTGEFFLCAFGGANTRYAISEGNNWWHGGTHIIPMAPEEAREWAEEHLNADDYEALFGEVPEGGDCTLISFNLLTCTAEMIKNQAESLGISIGAYITRLVGNDNQFQD